MTLNAFLAMVMAEPTLRLVRGGVVGVHHRDVRAGVGAGQVPARGDLARAERAERGPGQVHAVHAERLGLRQRAGAPGADRARDLDLRVAEREAAGHAGHVVQPGDRVDRRGGQRTVGRAGQVVDGLGARLAHAAVADPPAARPDLDPGPAVGRVELLGLRGHRDVGAHPVQALEHAGLGVADAFGGGADGDDQADAEGQAEGDDDRLAHPAAQFAPQVGEEKQRALLS